MPHNYSEDQLIQRSTAEFLKTVFCRILLCKSEKIVFLQEKERR